MPDRHGSHEEQAGAGSGLTAGPACPRASRRLSSLSQRKPAKGGTLARIPPPLPPQHARYSSAPRGGGALACPLFRSLSLLYDNHAVCCFCQVFVDAAHPPPLTSAWSSIVKAQPKQRDVAGQTSPASQPAKQPTPASPSKGSTVAAPGHSLQPPLQAQTTLSPQANGKQSSPTADKNAASPALANGFTSPKNSGDSHSAAAPEGGLQAAEPVDGRHSSSSGTSAQPLVCSPSSWIFTS